MMTYILDMKFGQWSPHQAESQILQTARDDTPSVLIGLEQEPGSAGKTIIEDYQNRVLANYTTETQRATGPKALRASPFLAAAEGGRIMMLQAGWNRKLRKEFRSFPNGEHDDVVDAVACAYNILHRQLPHAGVWGRLKAMGRGIRKEPGQHMVTIAGAEIPFNKRITWGRGRRGHGYDSLRHTEVSGHPLQQRRAGGRLW